MSITTYTGHPVVDQHGAPVGKVSDVFYDDDRDEPKWLVVDPGLLRKERLVPVDGSYETDDGRIILPFDKDWIKHAPTIDGEHYPDRATRQQAARHFELG